MKPPSPVSRPRLRGLLALGVMALLVLVAGAAFLTLAAPGRESRTPPNVVDRLSAAKIAFAQRDFARAEELLRGILEGRKEDLSARLFLGRVLLERGRLVQARQIFEDAVRTHPKELEALWGMAATLRAMGLSDPALLYYHQATKLPEGKGRPELWKGFALAQKEKGDFLGALASARESLALDKDQMDLARLLSELAAGSAGPPGVPPGSASLAFDPLNPRPIHPDTAVPRPKAPDPSQLLPKAGWRNR